MNKVTIDRELLERELLSVLDFSESNLRRVVDHLIDVGYTRAAPRQPEGDGLEVVGFSWLDTAHFRRKIPVHCIDEHWVALCRLSDAQRAIAELREECERVKADRASCWAEFKVMTRSCLEAEKERDTLRQQLAERDATIERLEAGIPRIQEQSHQMRKLRDKLEGLLRDLWEYTHDPELEQRIEAALAEVKP